MRTTKGRELYSGGDQCGRARRPVPRVRPRSSSWTATAPARSGRSTPLIPDKLDKGCEYVVQNDWTEYTELLERGCDAALFVGMHAKAGTPDGVLSHTVSGQAWRESEVQRRLRGETGINAALCGQWGCPVLLVTGDQAVCREGLELLGSGLTTVAVKTGLGRFSARQVPPLRAREMIEDGARRALQDLGRGALHPRPSV